MTPAIQVRGVGSRPISTTQGAQAPARGSALTERTSNVLPSGAERFYSAHPLRRIEWRRLTPYSGRQVPPFGRA